MSVCKGCGEPIRWIGSTRGKAIPVDPDIIRVYLSFTAPTTGIANKITLVLEDGTTISGWKRDRFESGVCRADGYESHFATCPKAEQFRKKKEQTA